MACSLHFLFPFCCIPFAEFQMALAQAVACKEKCQVPLCLEAMLTCVAQISPFSISHWWRELLELHETCWPLDLSTGEPTVHRRCRPHTMARGRRRKREQSAHTHNTSTSVGRSSAEEMAKLNSLSLLSCSGKLYIQLYPFNSSTQTCQAAMLLQ